MNTIWQRFLGIGQSPGEMSPVGSRLELTALPEGGAGLAVIVAAVALLFLLWSLYRRERKDLSRPRRALLVGLRGLVLLAVGVMLVEPVLVSSRIETLRSHLIFVVDDSESMEFSDPYTDESKAAEVASALELASNDGRPPVERLRETPRLDLAKLAISPQQEALSRGRELFVYDLATASQPGSLGGARSRPLNDVKPTRGVSPLGDALAGVLASHRGQPVAGVVLVSDGRSNAGEDPSRAAEAAVRRGIPIFPIAAGAEEGPRNVRLAELESNPVVFARDPTTVGVVVESRGLEDADANLVLERRVNGGDWEAISNRQIVLGEDGTLSRTTFRVVHEAVGDYELRAGSRTLGQN